MIEAKVASQNGEYWADVLGNRLDLFCMCFSFMQHQVLLQPEDDSHDGSIHISLALLYLALSGVEGPTMDNTGYNKVFE